MERHPFGSFLEPLFLVFTFCFVICVFSYFTMPAEVIPELWIENIRKTCPPLTLFESPRIKTFKKLLYSSIFFGIYSGCVLDSLGGPIQFSDSL